MSLVQQLHTAFMSFPDGVVLTADDADGYPVSLRCRPGPAGKNLILVRPKWFDVPGGPATLLAHGHDEQGGSLRSAQSRGTIENVDGRIIFTPLTFEETGRSPAQAVGMLRRSSRTAKAYLRRRDLPRPAIPWATIKAARAAVPKRG